MMTTVHRNRPRNAQHSVFRFAGNHTSRPLVALYIADRIHRRTRRTGAGVKSSAQPLRGARFGCVSHASCRGVFGAGLESWGLHSGSKLGAMHCCGAFDSTAVGSINITFHYSFFFAFSVFRQLPVTGLEVHRSKTTLYSSTKCIVVVIAIVALSTRPG